MAELINSPDGAMTWIRHTIMDGQVLTYCTHMELLEHHAMASPERHGPFEISSSRNAVMVHRATLRTEEDWKVFQRCLHQAWLDHAMLRACDGRPPDMAWPPMQGPSTEGHPPCDVSP